MADVEGWDEDDDEEESRRRRTAKQKRKKMINLRDKIQEMICPLCYWCSPCLTMSLYLSEP
jgi:hypothetical protein